MTLILVIIVVLVILALALWAAELVLTPVDARLVRAVQALLIVLAIIFIVHRSNLLR